MVQAYRAFMEALNAYVAEYDRLNLHRFEKIERGPA
jgi:hypothetical protein